MKRPIFNIDEWLSNLLLDEDRETYKNMTTDQQRLIRFAFSYGVQKSTFAFINEDNTK